MMFYPSERALSELDLKNWNKTALDNVKPYWLNYSCSTKQK